MTIPAVTAGALIDPAWGNAVAEQLNDLPLMIQAGALVGTTDPSSFLTVTFPVAFGAPPVVVATRRTITTNQVVAHVHSTTATQCVFRCTSNDATQPNVSGIEIDWVAVGVPA